MKNPIIPIIKKRNFNKRYPHLPALLLLMLAVLSVSAVLLLKTAAAPILTQKIVLRDAEKAQRENVTVNQGETLSTCYVETTPANVTNKAVTLTSSNEAIMTVT